MRVVQTFAKKQRIDALSSIDTVFTVAVLMKCRLYIVRRRHGYPEMDVL